MIHREILLGQRRSWRGETEGKFRGVVEFVKAKASLSHSTGGAARLGRRALHNSEYSMSTGRSACATY